MQLAARPDSHALSLIARGSAVGGSGSIESHLVHSAVEPGISRLTLAGPTGRALSTRKNTISQIPPNTATAPIHSVGWELSRELLTWSFSGARYGIEP
jgi:hypothetical protein